MAGGIARAPGQNIVAEIGSQSAAVNRVIASKACRVAGLVKVSVPVVAPGRFSLFANPVTVPVKAGLAVP